MQVTEQEFENFIKQLDEPEWYTQYRKDCFKKFQTLDMPGFKQGLNIKIQPDFDFNSVRPKAKPEVIKKITNPHDRIQIYSGNQMPHNDELKEFIADKWKEPEDENKIYYFNEAFANDFSIITGTPEKPAEIPTETPTQNQTETPTELNDFAYIAYEITDTPIITKTIILSNKFIHEIINTKTSSGNTIKYTSDDVRILGNGNHDLGYSTIQTLDKQTVHIQKRKAICEAQIKWNHFCFGSMYTKSTTNSDVNCPGVANTNTTLFIGDQDQQFDLYENVKNNAPKTRAFIKTVGALKGNAKALTESLIRVDKNAHNSYGHEAQRTILLSETAEADAIPKLEINNNDVQCSHASSVGQIDEDLMFYLQSRGLDDKTSQNIVVKGTFEPYLNIFDESLGQELDQIVDRALSG